MSSEEVILTSQHDAYGQRITREPQTSSTVEGGTAGEGANTGSDDSEVQQVSVESVSTAPESHREPPPGSVVEGQAPGAGTYQCTRCQQQVVIGEAQPLPSCPNCGGTYDPSYYYPVS